MILLLGGTATLGVLTQALVLLIPVHRSGFRYRPRFGFRGVGLGVASRMALWMLAVIGVSQTGMWLATNVLNRASDIEGSAAGKLAYENAFLFFILPHSLIATSLITAMFTQMSRSAHAEDLAALGDQYRHGLRLLGVAMVPISVGMFLLAPAVTATLLFDNSPEETLATAHITMALVVGLAPYAAYILSGRIFHAFQDGRTPFRMQVSITAVSVAGTLAAATLPPTMTAIGIGLAQTLGQVCAAVLGVLWVRRRLGGLPLGDVRTTYQRAVLAAVIAAVPTLLVILAGRELLSGSTATLVILAVGGPLFFTVYALVAHRLGVRELAEVAAPVLRRLGRGRAVTTASAAAGSDPGLGLAARGPGEGTSGEVPGRPTHHDQTGQRPEQDREERAVRGIEPGRALGGRYVLEELLARRGEALDYWSAQDSTLERLVAVTVLPADGEHENMAHAVLDGARRTAGVDDPRLVRVLDVGLEDGLCWIIEEGLVDAESLASLVAVHPVPAEEARRIVGEAATGLESARRRGLHHLFLSPHAVLRTREGGVKVSGVAVAAAIEQTEEVVPVEASLIDTSDLVSLLYTGLTGRWPGEEMEGLRPARRLADGSLPAPSEVVAGVPGDLDALCRMTLGVHYDPRKGPQTPGELARQLAPWSPDLVADEEPPSPDAPLDETGGAPAALAGSAGATAAATAAHPLEHDDGAGEVPTGQAPDPYYRTGDDRSDEDYVVDDEDYGEDSDEDARYAVAAPDRTMPPGVRSREPARSQTGVVLLLVLAIVAVGVFLAYGAISGLGNLAGGDPQREIPSVADPDPTSAEPTEPTEPTESTGPTESDDATTDEATETSTPSDAEETTASGEPITLVGITTYDPEGDDDERNDLVDRVIDEDPDTAWNSHTYLSPDWGSIKSGVGLVVDLGEPTEVSEVEIIFPQGDYGAEVFVSDQPSPEGATSIGADDSTPGTWTVTADEPATGRYVVVFFDRAWAGPEGEIVYVSEIMVR